MGNCCERQALKVIVEGRKGLKAYFITSRQLRDIKTYQHLFMTMKFSLLEYKYLYANNSNGVEFLRLSSDFKIKNLVLCTDTEYHISFEKLYCL